jgi:hypothetical protein
MTTELHLRLHTNVEIHYYHNVAPSEQRSVIVAIAVSLILCNVPIPRL